MKKTFSCKNANIETKIVVDYEMDNDGKVSTKTNYRVIKHGMGHSRTIMNSETWELTQELMFETNLQALEWIFNKNKDEWNNRNRIS